LRKKGIAQLEETTNVESMFQRSKLLKLMAKMMFKSKFEQMLAQSQRITSVLSEESESDQGW